MVPSPSTNLDVSGQTDRGWELIRIAYESHFELTRHYSSVIFQARIAITTVMVFAVAVGFGLLPQGDSATIEFMQVPGRGLIAYVAALLINLLYAMEVTYLVRLYLIVQSGRRIERAHNAPAYFAGFDRAASWPLYFAYLGGILVLVAIFLGAAWMPHQGRSRSAVLVVVGALPVAAFIRSYVRLVRSGRRLFESSSSET
jgi:hypothetical protein